MITRTLVSTGSFYRDENWKNNPHHASMCCEAVYSILGYRLLDFSEEKIKVYVSKERIHKKGCKKVKYNESDSFSIRVNGNGFCLHSRLEDALIKLGLITKEAKNDFFYVVIEELKQK